MQKEITDIILQKLSCVVSHIQLMGVSTIQEKQRLEKQQTISKLVYNKIKYSHLRE